MESFKLYIHGNPNGHKIVGNQEKREYINRFYDTHLLAKDDRVMFVEVCDGITYYTYFRRHKELQDADGRPNSFFAMTVGFVDAYTRNTYILFQLFDEVYKQLCIGTILEKNGERERYLVKQFESANNGQYQTVDAIQGAFTNKFPSLIKPYLETLNTGNTFNQSKKTVSLLEVDSPLFFEDFRNYSLIVSPELPTSAKQLESTTRDLQEISSQRNTLEAKAAQLENELTSIKAENKTLTEELRASSLTYEKKFQGKIEKCRDEIEELSQKLKKTANERDILRETISSAKNSVELIDIPYKQLTRLLAGRFPEEDQEGNNTVSKGSEKNNSKDKRQKRGQLNVIIQLSVLVICLVTLFTVLINSYKIFHMPSPINERTPETISEATKAEDKGKSTQQIGSEITIEESPIISRNNSTGEIIE